MFACRKTGLTGGSCVRLQAFLQKYMLRTTVRTQIFPAAVLSGCSSVDCEFWTQHVINDVKKPAYGHQKVLCKLVFDRRTFHQGCRKPKNTPDRSAGAVFEILAPTQISSRSLPEHPWLHGKYSCENNYEKNRTIQ